MPVCLWKQKSGGTWLEVGIPLSTIYLYDSEVEIPIS